MSVGDRPLREGAAIGRRQDSLPFSCGHDVPPYHLIIPEKEAAMDRRTFVTAVGASAVAASTAQAQPRRHRLAVVTTEWRDRSHAWHMAERFVHGYPTQGRWHRPPLDLVSAYVDQFPKNDLSRDRAKEFGFK